MEDGSARGNRAARFRAAPREIALPRALRWHHNNRFGDGVDQRNDTGHPPKRSIESQLAGHEEPIERARVELAGGHEQAQRDRQVECRAVFADVGRGQLDKSKCGQSSRRPCR